MTKNTITTISTQSARCASGGSLQNFSFWHAAADLRPAHARQLPGGNQSLCRSSAALPQIPAASDALLDRQLVTHCGHHEMSNYQ